MFRCPHCENYCAPSNPCCGHCGLDVDWLLLVPELQRALSDEISRSNQLSTDVPRPMPIGAVLPHLSEISLPTHLKQTLLLGRGMESEIVLHDPSLEIVHCILIWQWKTQQYWIADHRSRTGTFVNGRPVIAQQLSGGDLIQVGPYAWSFNAVDRLLVPVGPLAGMNVEVRNLSVGRRLQEVSFQLKPGEFVAVVGPSGHGKSTLIHALIQDPSTSSRGEILVNGQNVRQDLARFRSQLGYVAQNASLHADLSAKNTVAFSATLRGAPGKSVEQVLREVDFPDMRIQEGALCRELSGGESKRLRLGAELVASPSLLVLDEPGSGLDEEGEAGMMRLMRQRALRGGTILMVTHSRKLLDYCDRVLVVKKDADHVGRLFFNGSPQELHRHMPSGQFGELKKAPTESKSDQFRSSTGGIASSAGSSRRSCWLSGFRQLLPIIHRELVLLFSPNIQTLTRRLLLPVVLLPVFFAISIGLSVPMNGLEMLGFLSILACIWMGASLSLMAIVDEREAYDHERLLFLQIPPYVIAKMTVLGILALIQNLLFSGLLWGVRWMAFPGREDAMFYRPIGALACLISVSVAAVGLGLLISAISGRSRPAANFILPLVMMAQIVFSAQVAIEGNKSLTEAYREFQLSRPSLSSDSGQETRPSYLVVAASYFTLSRYGDISLRSFAYSGLSKLEDSRDERWRSLLWLSACCVAFPFLASIVLWCQERYGKMG